VSLVSLGCFCGQFSGFFNAGNPAAHVFKAIAKNFFVRREANFGIAIAKTWAAMVTGSGSMLAEAIHSYADACNQVLLYYGLRQSTRAPDVEHPLGYGKVSYFWSFIVAALLFSVGGLFSIYEGVHKFMQPEPLAQAWVALLVLAVAIVLESFSLLGALREIARIRGERPFREWLRHTRNSALVVVFGEDVAALLGLMSSRLVAFLKQEPKHLAAANAIREQFGLSPLR